MYIFYLVDKDNYESALKWCDYIILDEEINHPVDERMINKVAKRLSTPQDEMLEIMREGADGRGIQVISSDWLIDCMDRN